MTQPSREAVEAVLDEGAIGLAKHRYEGLPLVQKGIWKKWDDMREANRNRLIQRADKEFKAALQYAQEQVEDAPVLAGQINLEACAENVVHAWDNPSPGAEKWDRLRQKIEYLREALR